MPYETLHATPTPEVYAALRVGAGLSAKSAEAAARGLPNTLFAVQILHGGEPIGMGRVIGDGGTAFQVVDIAVLPAHQGQGLGKRIMGEIAAWLRANVPETGYVSLLADVPADALYAQFGFVHTAPRTSAWPGSVDMKIADMNWMQVEAYLQRDDRCLLPIGCTEQHAYLSLAVDAILAERVAVEAAEPLGVPVFPVLPFGITPGFMAYPGTVTLKVDTMLRVVQDLLDSLDHQGFRRILIVNGHGGNQPVAALLGEWMAAHPRTRVRMHNWWSAPKTMGHVKSIDPQSSHASWMENLPWTRLAGVSQPAGRKAPVDYQRYAVLPPEAAREMAGDGNFGGAYERPDDDVLAMWAIAVQETRSLIEGPWG